MCGCAHTCVRRAACVLRPGPGRAGGGVRAWVHVRLSPGGLFWSAECGRVYLISDVPSVFSTDINCQTMSNGAQMFPGGGLPSFASAMRVIKKSKGGVVFGRLLLQGRQREHAGGLQVSSPSWDAHARAAPAPAPLHPELCTGNAGVREQGPCKVLEVKPTGRRADLQDIPKRLPCPGCSKRLSWAAPGCRAAGMLACQPEVNTAACHFINILMHATRDHFTAGMALLENHSAAGASMHPGEHPRRGSVAAWGLWVPLGFVL